MDEGEEEETAMAVMVLIAVLCTGGRREHEITG